MSDRKKRPNIRNDNLMEKNRQAKENHAILQLLFIVGSFGIGYIPNAGTKPLGRKQKLNDDGENEQCRDLNCFDFAC